MQLLSELRNALYTYGASSAGHRGPGDPRTTSTDDNEGKGKAIMSASHRSATRLPGRRPSGRSQGEQRRGGLDRSSR